MKRTFVTTQKHGDRKKIVVVKRRQHCSSARLICIRCMTAVIHKNDSRYASKVCSNCERGTGTLQVPSLRVGAHRLLTVPPKPRGHLGSVDRGSIEAKASPLASSPIPTNEELGDHDRVQTTERSFVPESLKTLLKAAAARAKKKDCKKDYAFVGAMWGVAWKTGKLTDRQLTKVSIIAGWMNNKEAQQRFDELNGRD